MSKQRERTKRIFDWEELEKAPNTHGGFSFLKLAAEIVSIRKNDVPPEVIDRQRDTLSRDKTTTVVALATVLDKQASVPRRGTTNEHINCRRDWTKIEICSKILQR